MCFFIYILLLISLVWSRRKEGLKKSATSGVQWKTWEHVITDYGRLSVKGIRTGDLQLHEHTNPCDDGDDGGGGGGGDAGGGGDDGDGGDDGGGDDGGGDDGGSDNGGDAGDGGDDGGDDGRWW